MPPRIPRLLLPLLLLSLPYLSAAGELTVMAAFSDHMVLQRDQPVAINGWAAKGTAVSLAFAGQTCTGTADTAGAWRIALAPMPASSESRDLHIRSGAETITLRDVLVGDVWMCSGQSNMDRPLKSFNQLVPALATVKIPSLRLFAVDHHRSKTPLDQVVVNKGFADSWQICAEPYLSQFSPVGYFFGARLAKELGIPIGIIKAGQGATSIEPWVPMPVLTQLGMEKTTDANDLRCELYNAMIHPLRHVTLKGMLWYQGESNAKDPVSYARLFPGLITGWREAFGHPDLPFLFVQLASYGSSYDHEGEAWAWLREAQTKALSLPRTGMAVAIDLGEYQDIHPQAKELVADRLFRLAQVLEGRAMAASGPVFKAMEVQGVRCIITFDHTTGGLCTRQVVMNKQKDQPLFKDPQAYVVPADRLAGFTICGADRVFHPATARIVGSTVEVSAQEVPAPVAVRYGWANFALCNLFNGEGLPAAPFRTDDAPVPVAEPKHRR